MNKRIQLMKKAYELISEQWKIWGIESETYNSRSKTSKLIGDWEWRIDSVINNSENNSDHVEVCTYIYVIFKEIEWESIKNCFKKRKGYECENLEKKSELAYKCIVASCKDIVDKMKETFN